MRKAVIGFLKIALPLALGVWLVFNTYNDLNEQQRTELFAAFREANLWWLGASIVLGWFSHLSRAWRWRYLLEPLGHRVGFWNSYNAVMTGYFMNMLIPRAGEVSRGVTLYGSEGVPFEKGFGTILAERAVDMVMLLGIAAVTLVLQWDNIGLLQERISTYRAGQTPSEPSFLATWGLWLAGGLLLAGAAGMYVIWSRPELRARVMDGVRGFIAGVRSVFQTKDKLPFLFHTILIWSLYVAMFRVGFFALPSTAAVPLAGIMAGFIAGSIGIILVQGGIGVYPAFVGLIVTIYMPEIVGGGPIRPDALAMGWLLWAAQTIMLIGLGGVSLLLVSRSRKNTAT
jgi:hypothetical protein